MLEKKIEVIDSFLDEEDYQKLLTTMYSSSQFKWSVSRCLSGEKFAGDPKFNIQFTHLFYSNGNSSGPGEIFSDHYGLIEPMLNKLDGDILVKVKANFTVNRNLKYKQGFHVDMPKVLTGIGKTAIFYVNETNGGTLFSTDQYVDGIANRIVIFPNNLPHTAVTHDDDSPERLVINLNWIYSKYVKI